MNGREALSLRQRLEATHSSLPHPGRLMGLFSPIIRILVGYMECFGYDLSVSDAITAKLVGNDLPGLTLVTPNQSPEEPLCGSTVPSCLQIHINDLAVLIYGPPEIMLLAVDLHEYFVDEESIAVALMRSFKSFGISGTELYTPQPDGFVANCDAPFCKEIFNISVA